VVSAAVDAPVVLRRRSRRELAPTTQEKDRENDEGADEHGPALSDRHANRRDREKLRGAQSPG
jgi:hypothetical protein